MKIRLRKIIWIPLLVLVVVISGALIYFHRWNTAHEEFLEVGSDIDGYLATYSTDFQTISRALLLNSYGQSATVNFLAYPGTPQNTDGVIDISYRPLNGETPPAVAQQVDSYFASIAKIEKAKFKLNRLHSYTLGKAAETRVRFQVWGSLKDNRAFYDFGSLAVDFGKDQEGSWTITQQDVIAATRVIRPEKAMFTDVSVRSGLTSSPGWQMKLTEMVDKWKFAQVARFITRGVGVADVDKDGDLDVLLAGAERVSLWLNDGAGKFTEADWGLGPEQTSLALYPVFADVDNDGDPDVLLLRFQGQSRIFRNDGNKFTDVTKDSGLKFGQYVMTASFGDYDNDGYLDLFVGSYGNTKDDVPETLVRSRNGEPSQFYRNKGDWTFEDVTAKSGMTNTGWALASGFFDANADGKLDLYVANDFGYNPLYLNNGNGTFTDATWSSGASDIGSSMNVSFLDYDRDGDLDIYTSNIESNTQWFQGPGINYILGRFFTNRSTFNQTLNTFLDLGKNLSFEELKYLGYKASGGNSMFENLGDGKFKQVGPQTRTEWAEWAWGAAPGDFDCDGDTDIFVGNGFITGPDTRDL